MIDDPKRNQQDQSGSDDQSGYSSPMGEKGGQAGQDDSGNMGNRPEDADKSNSTVGQA